MYADDIVIFAKTSEEMQHNINILHDYCNRWKLSVNKDKTKIVVFRKGGRLPQNMHFYYGDSEIEVVSKYCYLGIVHTSGGSYKLIKPILCYGCEVWGFSRANNIERIQTMFCTNLLGVKTST